MEKGNIKKADRLHRSKLFPWCVWGLGALFGLYTFLIQGSPSVMIPQLIKIYKVDVVKMGVLTSSFFYTYILMQIPAGILVDLWGPRRVIKISFLSCSFAVGLFACSNAFWVGQTSRMLMGLFASPAIICALCLASRWFRPALFTLLATLTEFLALSGGVIGESGAAYSVVKLGWRQTMISIAFLGIFLTFLSLFFVYDYPNSEKSPRIGKTLRTLLSETKQNLKSVLKIGQIWIIGLYCGLAFALFPAFAALWSIPYFSLRYQVSTDISAYLASSLFLGACLGNLAIGWISIRYPRHKPLMLTGSILSLLLLLCILYIPHISFSAMFMMMLTLGFCSSTYILCFDAANHYVSEKQRGTAMGVTNMFSIIFGAPLLQPLIGYLLKYQSKTGKIGLKSYHLEDYHSAFIPLFISIIFALITLFFIKEKENNTNCKK